MKSYRSPKVYELFQQKNMQNSVVRGQQSIPVLDKDMVNKARIQKPQTVENQERHVVEENKETQMFDPNFTFSKPFAPKNSLESNNDVQSQKAEEGDSPLEAPA